MCIKLFYIKIRYVVIWQKNLLNFLFMLNKKTPELGVTYLGLYQSIKRLFLT